MVQPQTFVQKVLKQSRRKPLESGEAGTRRSDIEHTVFDVAKDPEQNPKPSEILARFVI